MDSSELSVRVDYLRYSAANGIPINSLVPYELTVNMADNLDPLPNYTHACKIAPAGRIDWNVRSETQGSLVTLSGGDLTDIYTDGITGEYLARFVAKNKWLHASRIDLAADLVGKNRNPTDILDAWRERRIKSHVRSCDQIIGYDADRERDGNTVMFGSRKSETFLRIYDKGLESKSDELWTRIEFELKGDRAKTANNKTAALSVGQVLYALLISFIQVTGVKWWTDAINALPQAKDILKDKRKSDKSNSQKWLELQALPAVCNAIIDSNEYVRDEILRALIAYNDKTNNLHPE